MESSIDRGWSWVIVIAVFGTSVLTFGFLQSTSVFFVDWQEDLNASAQMIGWCSSISIAGFGLAGLISSVISSYVSCRWQAFVGGLVTAAALACSNWVTHLFHLYAIMCFIGFGTGIAYINCFALIGFYFNKKLAVANGLVRAVVGVNLVKKILGVAIIIQHSGAIISLPLIGHLYDTTGDYAMAFYISGGVMLLNGIIVLLDPLWIKLDRRRLKTNKPDGYDAQELG
ncbi:monocarboxylate transporter 13-like [Amphiura filiformis]|uniref:monocarboxylate transporter 13-like n=1 Tax=Amphiura filiformis TaxID=82378 RepID=UPI003B21369F